MQDTSRIREEHAGTSPAKPHPAGSDRDYELMILIRDRFAAAGLEDVESPRTKYCCRDLRRSWSRSRHRSRGERRCRSSRWLETAIRRYCRQRRASPLPRILRLGRPDGAGHRCGRRRCCRLRCTCSPGRRRARRIVLVRNPRLHSRSIEGRRCSRRNSTARSPSSCIPTATRPCRAGAPTATDRCAPSHIIERGGVPYDFIVPGDPLTPGWASVPGAPRIDAAEAASLPRIISVPISAGDAHRIRQTTGAIVHLRVHIDQRVRPVWTVTGTIRGSRDSGEVVIVGNHRDAWIYGGVDPSSGTAASIELVRTLGELTRSGWRPQRSILFASLGCRGVRARVVDRVGRTERRGAVAKRRRLHQR